MALTSGIWYAALAYAALAVYTDMRRRDFTCAILAIAVFGMQLFLLLWEARGRYMFSYVPLMLLLAAGSISRPERCMSAVKEGWLWQRVMAKRGRW